MSPLAPRGVTDTALRPVLEIPGPRWFGPRDAIWRVHSDACTPIGITTGLLMLTANPAFAAIFDHAGAVENPWLADEYLQDLAELCTFGTVDDAVVTIERSRTSCAGLIGTTEHGEFYYGPDPELLAWAHSATTWALLAAFQRFSETPLTAAETDEFVEQSARAARLQGVRTAPSSARELERRLRGASDRVRPTVAGPRMAARLRETATTCQRTDDASPTTHVRCTTVVAAASSLLPSDVRRALGLPTATINREAVFGRIAEAHQGLTEPQITTPAPIAAPSSLR